MFLRWWCVGGGCVLWVLCCCRWVRKTINIMMNFCLVWRELRAQVCGGYILYDICCCCCSSWHEWYERTFRVSVHHIIAVRIQMHNIHARKCSRLQQTKIIHRCVYDIYAYGNGIGNGGYAGFAHRHAKIVGCKCASADTRKHAFNLFGCVGSVCICVHIILICDFDASHMMSRSYFASQNVLTTCLVCAHRFKGHTQLCAPQRNYSNWPF